MLDMRPARWHFHSDDALVFSGSFKLKTAAEDFSVVPPFEIRSGAEQRVPFLFNSPHSGRYYPERFLAMARLDRNAIRRSEDCYVDELFGGAVALGAPMLAANFPRAYLDVNREPWELDPRMFAEPVPSFCNIRSARVAGGLGTVPKLVGEGLDIYSGRLPLAEAVARIEAVYKPYHETLKRLLTQNPCPVRLCRADRLPFDAGQHPGRRQRPAAGLHHRRPLRHLGHARR